MRKNLIRKRYLQKRRELTSSKFEEESSKIIKKTIDFIKNYDLKYVHCFLPIKTKYEINTLPIIKYCWDSDIKVLIPVSNFEDGTLKSAEFNPNTKTLQTKNNITEPMEPIWYKNKTIDIIITPLLAFDLKGHRVGYGKGFYDRFFSTVNQDTKIIGLSLFEACKKIENTNENDIPLTYCVTPQKIYSF